jgi:hypothetical protein
VAAESRRLPANDTFRLQEIIPENLARRLGSSLRRSAFHSIDHLVALIPG